PAIPQVRGGGRLRERPSCKPLCRTAGTSWEPKSLPAPRCKREFAMLPSGIALHDEDCKQACSSGSRCIFRDESLGLSCPWKRQFLNQSSRWKKCRAPDLEPFTQRLQRGSWL